jgi:hypothetical protein
MFTPLLIKDLRDLFNLISARQQRQRMKMVLGDRIGRRLIASLKLKVGSPHLSVTTITKR